MREAEEDFGGAKLMVGHRPACFVRQLFDLAQIVERPTDRTLFYQPG
jgi:hypothetical protein